MTINLVPEAGVPLSKPAPKLDLKQRTAAAEKTTELLEQHGLDVSPTSDDKEVAAALVTAYAADPEKTSNTANNQRAAQLTPAVLRETNHILSEWGRQVAGNAATIRHLVTNKLLTETENPDPRVRLKALELLGKISDVGLFAEKSEVTVTHQSTDDLKEKLRQKLQKLSRTHDQEPIEDAIIIDGNTVDVDKELGFDD